MKKLTALLMAIVLCLSLAACSSKPDILGTYETTLDLTDLVVSEFDNGAGFNDDSLSLANYMDSFSLKLITEFKEDGTYYQYVDSESLTAALDGMEAAILPVLDDFMLASFIDQLSQYGYNIATREDVEGILNMSWDSIFESSAGMDMETMIAQLMDGLSAELDLDETILEGKYKAEDGKLYLSEGLEYEIDEEAYEFYELNEGGFTVLAGVGIEESEYIDYPYIMTKIS